jgi:ElaB/YqjD/DUF883 family membrane-anchored ribosome-binding protein
MTLNWPFIVYARIFILSWEPDVSNSTANERLMTDVKVVLTDAENLLNRAAEATGDHAADLRERGMQMLRQARVSAQELQETAVARGRAAGRAADAYVHEHPWRVIGIAAGVGLLAGLLLNRR